MGDFRHVFPPRKGIVQDSISMLLILTEIVKSTLFIRPSNFSMSVETTVETHLFFLLHQVIARILLNFYIFPCSLPMKLKTFHVKIAISLSC